MFTGTYTYTYICISPKQPVTSPSIVCTISTTHISNGLGLMGHCKHTLWEDLVFDTWSADALVSHEGRFQKVSSPAAVMLTPVQVRMEGLCRLREHPFEQGMIIHIYMSRYSYIYRYSNLCM